MDLNIKWLEWEDFENTKGEILEHGNLCEYFKTIEIKRDDNYRIIFELKGETPTGTRFEDIEQKIQLKAGESFNPENEVIIKPDGINPYSRIKIKELIISNYHQQGFKYISATGEIFNMSCYNDYTDITGDVLEINDEKDIESEESKEEIKRDEKYINYWFINGIKDMEYAVTRKIEFNSTLMIEYSGLFKDKITQTQGTDYSSHYQILNFKGKPFVFGYVDQKTIGEYPGTFFKFEFDNAPNEDELEVLKYAFIYVMGIDLIPIGCTIYDAFNSPIEKILKSTFRHNLKEICSNIPMPPIPIDRITRMIMCKPGNPYINILDELNFFIEKFFEYYERFHLKQIVNYINSSRLQLLDTQIQPLATALEVFQKAWFTSDYSTSKGKYLKNEDFDPLIGRFIPDIEIELRDIENKKIMIKKIKSANDIGFTQKFPVMFKEMKLETRDVEEISLLERNIVIHGTLRAKDYNRLRILTNAFISLIHRTILKLFNYQNFYIDYSAYGFPLKKVDEPLGGPQNDCKI